LSPAKGQNSQEHLPLASLLSLLPNVLDVKFTKNSAF
jgi:hypothetical protein